jgi:hypothetical protein
VLPFDEAAVPVVESILMVADLLEPVVIAMTIEMA